MFSFYIAKSLYLHGPLFAEYFLGSSIPKSDALAYIRESFLGLLAWNHFTDLESLGGQLVEEVRKLVLKMAV